MMEMKYPSLNQFIKSNFDFTEENQVEQSFELIGSCIDKIYSEDEVWSTADVSKKEVNVIGNVIGNVIVVNVIGNVVVLNVMW